MERIIVIGGVAAGTTAATRLKRCCPEAEVVVYEQGSHAAYSG